MSLRLTVMAMIATAGLAAVAVEVDGVAAKVGTETILKSDVIAEMQRRGATEKDYVSVRNEMIDRKLILKAASEAKMTMQSWVVESRIREIVNRSFGGDRNKLMAMLSQQKVSYPEWVAKMKEDMILSAMRWNVVDKNVTASPSAMRAEYEKNPQRYSTQGTVSVSVILLKPEDSKRRDEISTALKDVPFADLARTYSSDSRAEEGGAWKDVKPEEVFRPEICKEIASMPKGTISRWIEIDGWSFLLRKDSESTGKRLTFVEAYDEIEKNVKEELSRKAYDAWIERLRAETYVKVF